MISEIWLRYNADNGKGDRVNIIPVLLVTIVAPFRSIIGLSPVCIELVNFLHQLRKVHDSMSLVQNTKISPPFTYHPHALVGLFVRCISHNYYVENITGGNIYNFGHNPGSLDIRSQTVQPVVSRYTDWAIRPTSCLVVLPNIKNAAP